MKKNNEMGSLDFTKKGFIKKGNTEINKNVSSWNKLKHTENKKKKTPNKWVLFLFKLRTCKVFFILRICYKVWENKKIKKIKNKK